MKPYFIALGDFTEPAQQGHWIDLDHIQSIGKMSRALQPASTQAVPHGQHTSPPCGVAQFSMTLAFQNQATTIVRSLPGVCWNDEGFWEVAEGYQEQYNVKSDVMVDRIAKMRFFEHTHRDLLVAWLNKDLVAGTIVMPEQIKGYPKE